MLTPIARIAVAGLLSIAAIGAAGQSVHAAQAVAVTFECTSDVTVDASPGDTLILTAGASCPIAGATDDTEFYLANINGSSFSPTGSEFPANNNGWPSSNGWTGTATGLGSLNFTAGGTLQRLNQATSVGAMAYAFYLQPGLTQFATVNATDGAGNVTEPGSVIAAVYYYWAGGGTYPDGTTALIRLASDSEQSPDSPAPPPWLKAIGREVVEQCPEGMNPSWAMWPNNGTGGFTCEWREEYTGNFLWTERPGFYG